MKIQQETLPFQPITIKLETREEAEAFVHIMDSHSPTGKYTSPTTENARTMAIDLSNAFSDGEVTT